MVKSSDVTARVGFLGSQEEQIRSGTNIVLASGSLSLGPQAAAAEELWPQEGGAGNSVVVSNGTIALEIAWNVLWCDHVIVPEMTVPMVKWAATRRLGPKIPENVVTVEQVDVDETHCLNLELAEEAATRAAAQGKRVGICYVATGGLCHAELHAWIQRMRALKIKVVVDMSHAHGATLNGYGLYAHADAATWSFYATKVLTSGEGGAVWFAKSEHVAAARVIANQGKRRDSGVFEREGLNARMSEFAAAVLFRDIMHAGEVYAARQAIAQVYDEAGIPGIHQRVRGLKTSFYKYVVPVSATRFGRDSADVVERAFAEHGVRCAGRVHGFADNGGTPWTGEQAKRLAKNHVCLPIGRLMSQADAEVVVAAWKNLKV